MARNDYRTVTVNDGVRARVAATHDVHRTDKKKAKAGGDIATRELTRMTAWTALLLAGLMEIAWALGLKFSGGFTRVWPSVGTVMALGSSFVFLGLSLRTVPLGTAYAVWTGIGAIGAAVAGMVLFGEPVNAFRILCLALIFSGIVGLRLTPQ
jgi:quaternary ammonium compound-resistance protein SugE